MPRSVSVSSGPVIYDQSISVGPHTLHSDEPAEIGGKDVGPNATELLMAALGACTTITAQMYAEKHQLPLKGVRAVLSYTRVLAENPDDSGPRIGMVDQVEMEVSFTGELSEEQRNRLFEVANHCPVHRMLNSGVKVQSRLLVSSSAAA